ncbi:hypothetical protein Q5H93_06495 [Hymenobacter sp. ASUV-10]|uniref:Uncharacterized protein n=1 Tax=Hymenobacter aranciens TaxID=3063996 RepID=A0ABT9B996_9BACT|nr:hypothetical protein [Hymenobacter sp. ASUV-10]MDO7874375.1 hypothetical protein [Hymenobacter sp. ASUV-10]
MTSQAQGLAGPTAVTHSPYYHAYQPKAIPGATARIGVLPARLQHPAASRILSQTRAPELLDSLTRYLGRQPGLTPVALPADTKLNHLPDVYFGSPDQDPPSELPDYVRNLQNPNPGKGVVQLAGWNGQGKTRQALVALMAAQHLDYLLVPIVREANLYFSMKIKSAGPLSTGQATGTDYYLDEGSDHIVHFSRLEDLNSYATVLVLTGALLNARGELVLVGAEGLKDTGVGFQPKRLVTLTPYAFLASDYNELLRPTPAGMPATWQGPVNQWMQRLTGRRPYREDSPYRFLLVDQPNQQH